MAEPFPDRVYLPICFHNDAWGDCDSELDFIQERRGLLRWA